MEFPSKGIYLCLLLISCDILDPWGWGTDDGAIMVTSYPSEASIYLNEEWAGKTTPDRLIHLERKTHEIEVRLEGYESAARTVKLTDQQPVAEVHFNLIRAQTHLTTNPSGAFVYIRESLFSSLTPTTLPLNSKDIRCQLAGHFPVEVHFPLDSIPATLHFDLQPTPSAWISGSEDEGIHLINPDGIEATLLANGESQTSAWSSDGQLLAYQGNDDWDPEIKVIDREGTQIAYLESWRDVAWSHIGLILAMANSESIGTYDVYSHRMNRLLFPGASHFANPQFSPDDQWILFETQKNEDEYKHRVGLIGAHGEKPRYLAGPYLLDYDPDQMRPQWMSQDEILYLKPGGLFAQSLQYQLERRVFEDDNIVTFLISPDRQKVAILASQGLFKLSLPDWNLLMWWQKNKNLEVSFDEIEEITWDPTSQAIIFSSDYSLWWLDGAENLFRIVGGTYTGRDVHDIHSIQK